MSAIVENQPQDTETAVEQVLATSIEILAIKKGDTVIVRADAADPNQLAFINHVMFTIFQRHGFGPDDVHLLIIPKNLDVSILDEAAMKKQGWERRGLITVPGMPGNGRP